MVINMVDIGRDLQRAFDDGEWSMFKQITSAYYGKEYYFLEPDGTVYSRYSGMTLLSKEAAYREFVNEICGD